MSHPESIQRPKNFLLKVSGGFILAAAILILLGLTSYTSIKQFQETSQWIAHTQETLAELQSVFSNTLEAVSGVRGYVITEKERFLEPYHQTLLSLDHDQKQLASLIQDNPDQKRRLNHLNHLIDEQLALLQSKVDLRKEGLYSPEQVEIHMNRNKALMDAIRVAAKEMQAVENDLLLQREQMAEKKGKETIVTSVIGVVLEILLLIWVFKQIRHEIAARQHAQDALKSAHNQLEQRVVERTHALVDANERLRQLSRRLMTVQEHERREIAHDLHDEIGQSLTAMKLSLCEASTQLAGRRSLPFLQDSLDILNHVIQQVRNLALDLRPSLLDELGLVPAIKWFVNGQGKRAGWNTEFVVDGDIERLPPEVELACFRVVQEALTNVARHADATHVRVKLGMNDNLLHLEIEDNGKGFDLGSARALAKAGSSVGLLGMEERIRLVGGGFFIASARETGTKISASLALAERLPQPVATEERM